MKIYKAIKEKFIKDYLKEYTTADITDRFFVDEYIKRFNPKYKRVCYGAHKCSELGILLSNMYKCGILTRGRIGLSKKNGMEDGFPKWVYVYELTTSYP